MASTSDEGVLFLAPAGPPEGVVINARCRVEEREGYRVVSVSGLPLAHFAAGDRAGEAYAMVSLVELGWARQAEVARAFGCDVRTVRRHQRRFEEGGLAALGRPRGFPRGQSRVSPSRREAIDRWKAEGVSNREIARRLGIDEKAVRKLVRRLVWPEPRVEQAALAFEGADPKLSGRADSSGARARPTGSEASEAAGAPADPRLSALVDEPDPVPRPLSLDRDPADRSGERLLARLGLPEDAAPLFGASTQVPGAGVLLAMPALVASGVLSLAREIYGGLGPAFYGLRTTLVTLLLMALLRVKRPEGLKERSPRQLGQVLGLDRAPEVKTLRRKLARLAAPTEANRGLVKVLPGVLAEVRELVGERRVTVVFDRGGWSPKLFAQILADGFDLLTYRKAPYRPVPLGRFRRHRETLDGRTLDYWLADQPVRLEYGPQGRRKRLSLRQVTRLSESGHQTPILTSRRDLSTLEVAYRMFERWGQENFFKYLREEFALDALVDYATEPADAERHVPNPERKKLDAELRQARAHLE